MIKQASVKAIRDGEITRENGYVVIAMCFYPRGLRKDLRDEYRGDLAPDRQLFKEWKYFSNKFGHEEAFAKSDYERRFKLGEEARYHLRELAEKSQEKDIYLVCECKVGERCHRELIMLDAKRNFDAKIDKVHHDYPVYLERIEKGDKDGVPKPGR